ncbi:MAG TPA: transporter [Mycobacterium sp.]|nr:transporter [Mycobacterium sp.]
MNTGTLIGSLVFAAILIVVIAFLVRQMVKGWRHRAQRQAGIIGTLPPLPDTVGAATTPAMKGLYVGSTIAPSWQDRIAVGDLGYRAKAVLTRYPEGIMLQRSGAHPIWIPQESISAVRTERGIAGKVIPGGRSAATRGKTPPHDGILAIRWKLPGGTEIDTGFRADDRRQYENWVSREELA